MLTLNPVGLQIRPNAHSLNRYDISHPVMLTNPEKI